MSPETRNLLLVLSGLALVMVGVWILLRARKFKLRRSAQTIAVVREIIFYDGEYHPVYVYTANGVEYSQWGVAGISFYLKKMVGQEVTVFYDPDDPDIYALNKNNESQIIWMMLVCIVCGIGLMAWGFYSMVTGQ